MEIKILGEGCDKCTKVLENTKIALSELALEAKLEKVEDIVEMMKHGVMSTPAIVINGKVKAVGRIFSVKEIKEYISEELN
jgi:small redox-active disulfide protein 2